MTKAQNAHISYRRQYPCEKVNLLETLRPKHNKTLTKEEDKADHDIGLGPP
jgi:hypothetical protein